METSTAPATSSFRPGKPSRQSETPFTGFVTLMGVFGFALTALVTSRSVKRRAPEKMALTDLALLGAATHRLTRIISEDWVAAPLRAPFTEEVRSPESGETEEEGRGTGLRKAVGELLTCRFCLGPWIAFGFVSGLVLWPRRTRVVASVFSVSTVSDFLHRAYGRLKK